MMMMKKKVMKNLEKIENARKAGVGVSRQVFGNIPMTEVLSKQVGFSFLLSFSKTMIKASMQGSI
jgi:hypothetical protein